LLRGLGLSNQMVNTYIEKYQNNAMCFAQLYIYIFIPIHNNTTKY
jgi:hypothetical protein